MEDIQVGDNRNFYFPISLRTEQAFINEPQKVLVFDMIKSFIEKLSCGYVHVRVSCIIWDALFTIKHKEHKEMYLIFALSIITVLLKNEGILPSYSQTELDKPQDQRIPLSNNYCSTIYDLIKLIEKKGSSNIHEFEFFKKYQEIMLYF